MATQNPIEQEGTYPLPEAQTDRFLFKLIVDYPTETEERQMMERWGQVTHQPEIKAVSSAEELLAIRFEVDKVPISASLQNYILSLVRATRALADKTLPPAQRLLEYGASPRASLALFQASRALAWLKGDAFVSPSIVQSVFADCMRHRIGLTYEAEAESLNADTILRQVMDTTPIPPLT